MKKCRKTTDWDEGSPGAPRPGETLAQWSARAREAGYAQYQYINVIPYIPDDAGRIRYLNVPPHRLDLNTPDELALKEFKRWLKKVRKQQRKETSK